MKDIFPILGVCAVTLVVALVLHASGAEPTSKPGGGARTPVLVELFTSEGCSSCPAADEVLQSLAAEQPVEGAQIIPLGEHVDYWNQLGWKDAFSSAAMTSRQMDYAAAAGLRSAYTPQMIVDGQSEFIGSNRGKALEAITAAAQARKGTILLNVRPDASAKTFALAVHAVISSLPQLSRNDSTDVIVALTQDGVTSKVLRGENSGRTLHHAAVVRSLKRVGTISRDGDSIFDAMLAAPADVDGKLDALHVVVFVQERSSKRILAAATAAPAQ
jgi:hypothetical protein